MDCKASHLCSRLSLVQNEIISGRAVNIWAIWQSSLPATRSRFHLFDASPTDWTALARPRTLRGRSHPGGTTKEVASNVSFGMLGKRLGFQWLSNVSLAVFNDHKLCHSLPILLTLVACCCSLQSVCTRLTIGLDRASLQAHQSAAGIILLRSGTCGPA